MIFRWARAVVPVCFVVAVCAQAQAPLANRDAFELYNRAVQLMEASAVAVPELSRAGAPLTENARAAVSTLRSLNRQHAGVTNSFLTNVRAYLALADAVPKPEPFPEQSSKQLAELRDIFNRTEANFRALLEQKESQLRNPDRDSVARYAEANARLAPPVAGRPRIVFLGDSITDGWRLNEYFADRDFVNRGISGQITGEMLGRMKADVIDVKPAAVLVLAGTNDIARGVPLAIIENNLAMIAELAVFNRIKPLFASVLPVSDYHKDQNAAFEMTRVRPPQQIRSLNEWIERYCRERGFVYVDYYSAMADAKGYLKADLADDGLHPNGSGYRVMAPIAVAAIDKVTGAATPQQRGKRRRD